MPDDRLENLARRLRLLRLYLVVLSAALAALVLSAFGGQGAGSRVLRLRGIIIEDAQGRERILIGAPTPFAKNRVRTDWKRVEAAWAKRFPPQYREWYKGYRHDTNGLLILEESGFDRLALGDPVPDPNVGKRIGPGTGLVVNDSEGFERTGYSLINVQGNYRVVLGLDDMRGREGLTVVLDDRGRRGVSVHDSEQTLFLGAGQEPSATGQAPKPYFGLLIRDGQETRHKLTTAQR